MIVLLPSGASAPALFLAYKPTWYVILSKYAVIVYVVRKN
jgi:hypothetical protein